MIVQSAAAEPSLESLLIEHVHGLSLWEQVFGPATALRSFGRLYTSIARRPQWLVPGEVKQCFRNATAFALVRDDVTYVEGFALDPALPIPLEHAWLVDDKGQVIDPTWDDNIGHVYYGVPFEINFVAAMMEQSGGQCGLLDHRLLRRHAESEFEQGVAHRPSEGALRIAGRMRAFRSLG
ncbi:hypothetical protein [Rhizobium leguminosarum]